MEVDKMIEDVGTMFFPSDLEKLSEVADKFASWSDSARQAAVEARRGGKSKPTVAQKELYTRVKNIDDRLSNYAVQNRKVGVAEGKSRAWAKKAAELGYYARSTQNAVMKASGEKLMRRALEISASYKKKATECSSLRDALKPRSVVMEAKGVKDMEIDDIIQKVNDGELDEAIGAELDEEIGLTAEDLALWGKSKGLDGEQSKDAVKGIVDDEEIELLKAISEVFVDKADLALQPPTEATQPVSSPQVSYPPIYVDSSALGLGADDVGKVFNVTGKVKVISSAISVSDQGERESWQLELHSLEIGEEAGSGEADEPEE